MTTLLGDAVVVLQAGLVLAVLEAVRRRNPPATVNGLVALGAALLPATLRTVLRLGPGINLNFGPELPLWIAAAGLIHAVGMLGLYDSVWWWDHVAHTVSAALVAALVYAAVLVVAAGSPFGQVSPMGVAAVTLGFVLVFSVVWELVEALAHQLADRYDIGPMLVVYGPYDAVFDLAFNLVGTALVLLLDVRVFVSVFEPYPNGTATILFVVGSVGLGAGGLLATVLYVTRDD